MEIILAFVSALAAVVSVYFVFRTRRKASDEEHDGYVVQLERVREKFIADLASVEAQNQMYRQENMKIIGPGT